jgi:hypothetical protein
MSVADLSSSPDKHLSRQMDKVEQIERLVMFVFLYLGYLVQLLLLHGRVTTVNHVRKYEI